ncbi:HtaA domain-containing protein [Paenarthrobacter ureafaciens]|uniref:HtaA domain-containing protein n=1 Tax=Paenarthrobacter ureafaciens TaxID=37931 RepID=UPI002DB69D04|nr:HtaA domain-containing protein [Paenarthrobacter ureafaciens]MEC3853900.1 HtaA domain-containing protein [Paenarthrobacter ureafaciens]
MFFRRRLNRPGLVWGIRESLTSYVASLPDGAISVDEGADFVPKVHPPRFWFPFVSHTEREAHFSGAASISAHGGLLQVVARDPWLHFAANRTVLSLFSDGIDRRIQVAVVGTVDRAIQRAEMPAHLTVEGAAWLGPNYSPGDPVSSLTFRRPSTIDRRRR